MQQDGSLVSNDIVYVECLFGGVWNVRRHPECVRKWKHFLSVLISFYVSTFSLGVFSLLFSSSHYYYKEEIVMSVKMKLFVLYSFFTLLFRGLFTII